MPNQWEVFHAGRLRIPLAGCDIGYCRWHRDCLVVGADTLFRSVTPGGQASLKCNGPFT